MSCANWLQLLNRVLSKRQEEEKDKHVLWLPDVVF